MAARTNKKKMDLPPKGPRNADPISDEAGAHPIETGVGAAVGGAAAGLAAGAAVGPVGAVAGAIIGGVAGGFAGKAAGEWIDPTTDPEFQREFHNRSYIREGETFDDYKPLYQYGGRVESSQVGKTFSEVELLAQEEYEKYENQRPWQEVRPAVEDGYKRAQQLRDRQRND